MILNLAEYKRKGKVMKPLQTKPNKISFWSKLSTASLDFNGTEFDLEFASKNGKFQTKLGGYLTLILSFITILAFILSASQLFSDNSPVVNITPEYNPDEIIMKLYDEDLAMPLMFKKGNKLISSTQELSKYFTAKVFSGLSDFDTDKGKFVYKWIHEFPVIPCSQVAQKNSRITELVDQLFKQSESLKKFLFCPDLGDKAEFFILSTGEETLARGFTRVRIYPCSLPDSSKCATPAELDDVEVTFYSNNKILEASNFDEPVKYSPKKHKLKVDRTTRKFLKYYFDVNVIVDDSNQIRAGKTKARFTTVNLEGDNRRTRDPSIIHCTPEEIAKGFFNRCNYLLDLQLIPRKSIIKIRRSYKKASAMLAEFGGYLKLILTVIFFVYSIRASEKMIKYLVENIWPQSGGPPKSQGFPNNSKNDKEEVFELVKSRTGVEDFQENISFIDVLKNRFSEKAKDSSQIGVLQNGPTNITEQKQESDSRNKGSSLGNQEKAEMLERFVNRSDLSDAYKNIKTASRLSSSNFKKVINLYFLDLLKSDFEAE